MARIPGYPSHPGYPGSIPGQGIKISIQATIHCCLAGISYFSYLMSWFQNHLLTETIIGQFHREQTLRWEGMGEGLIKQCWSGERRLNGAGDTGQAKGRP